MTRYWLARRAYPLEGLPLEDFAAAADLHPQLIRRLVALGLLRCERDDAGHYRFPATELARVARIQRLRAGLGLNYAGVGVVLDLLDRIEVLEAALRTRQWEGR